MKKTCHKKNTAFNYTKTVEQTYTRSILIKVTPMAEQKN